MIYLFSALHLCVCAFFIFLMSRHRVNIPLCLAPLIIFVPVFGLLTAAALHFAPEVQKDITLESVKALDESYKSIFKAVDRQDAVPLADALLLDDEATRRSLMLDALSESPESYVDLFRKARRSSDAEVSHYAATALAELDKACFEQLAFAEREYRKNKNARTTEKYLSCTQRCIALGAADKELKRQLRITLIMLLKRLIMLCGKSESRLEALFDAQLLCGETGGAAKTLELMQKLYPYGKYVICSIRLCFEIRDGKALANCIAFAHENNIYLTHRQQKVLEFWKC